MRLTVKDVCFQRLQPTFFKVLALLECLLFVATNIAVGASKLPVEKQLTFGPHNRILTNINVWSPDGEWIVYDVRPDAEGSVFEGSRIEAVNRQGEIKSLYESHNGAHCGVATWHPYKKQVVFILGPENPTSDWQYGPTHRQGVIVDAARPGEKSNLDARDLTASTPGALRGGSHVHVWHPRGDWVSFTYNDHLLAPWQTDTADHDSDQRNVGVSVPRPVQVPTAPRNHSGNYYSALVTRTKANPRPGSDEIKRAFEESWIGSDGYIKPDGTRQKRALAFQGEVVTETGETISEVFVVDLPDDLTQPSPYGPLQGTLTTRPVPPQGVTQRRLTFTTGRKYPGIQGPRHWLRTSPQGAQIAFLMRDDDGVVQLWTISPNGGTPRQVTHGRWSVASAFSWRPDGKYIACAADNSIFAVDVNTGKSRRLTPRSRDADAPLPLACVFSSDGRSIAYQRRVDEKDGARYNQIFVCSFE
jgi:Tol biopolymer transport system component